MRNRQRSITQAVGTSLMGLGLLAAPSLGWSACCGSACTARIIQAEATLLTRIQIMEEMIVQAIGTHAEKIHYTISDQTEAQASMINGLADVIREQLERQKVYDAQAQVHRDYANPPPTICHDANAAAAAVKGSGAAQQAGREIQEDLDERWEMKNTTPSDEIVSAYQTLEDEPSYLDAERLLIGPTAFSEEDEKKRRELLRRLYSFTPPAQLDEDSSKSPQGIVFKTKRKEQEVRLAPVKSILSSLGGNKAATYQFSPELETMLAETGYMETELGREAVESARREGGMSAALFEKVVVESRSVNSPKYLAYLEAMTSDKDLQRELIKQVSINNQLLYAQLNMDRRHALLAASSEADRLDRDFTPQLNALRVGGAASSPKATFK